ncbi:hypothetical protein DKT77_13375 [Meridianimarinicoccus roseus]|jgi:hypothetical protein|uniref:Uncharacterized protein n=1 Tax=Meridianimarinicoccus roseus TaxID=2072018 RepID=A0A2V2L9L0_9RHOB|nr:hypothetical protein [Meridianimarinicoccus roseus]PWR02138.1 hypothetical protein DKT77_13375 [Meridianimarinicoccus roseus]
MPTIEFHYYPLDEKGGHKPPKADSSKDETDVFDFAFSTGDSGEADLSDLVLLQGSTTAGIADISDCLISSYQTGGSGGYDQVTQDETMTSGYDWFG